MNRLNFIFNSFSSEGGGVLKKNFESIDFYRIISLTLVLIVFGMILFICSNEILRFSDSFLGALLGALITGGTAILVFKLGEVSKRREEEYKNEKIKVNLFKRLKYVNKHYKALIHNYMVKYEGDADPKLSTLDKQYIESYILKLKRLTNLLDSLDANQLDIELLEEFYHYKLNLEYVYDEMYRFYYTIDEKTRDFIYKEMITNLFKKVEADIKAFDEYIYNKFSIK